MMPRAKLFGTQGHFTGVTEPITVAYQRCVKAATVFFEDHDFEDLDERNDEIDKLALFLFQSKTGIEADQVATWSLTKALQAYEAKVIDQAGGNTEITEQERGSHRGPTRAALA